MTPNIGKGGYDVEFVAGIPKNGSCSICLLVLREPMQADECGHRFCKSCVEDLKGENGSITCPQDRTVNKIFRDKGKERDILDYMIKCTNVSKGCQWNGELRDLEKHTDICWYQLIPCENEGCKAEVRRKYMLLHVNAECTLRYVECQYCKMKIKICRLEEHNVVCEKRPIECSRCKSKDIIRHLMNQHLEKDCPMTYHDCEYSDIGCQEKVKRDCISSHKKNSTENHLDCTINKLREQEKIFQAQLQDKENQLKRQRTEIDNQSETIKRQKVQLEEQGSTITSLRAEVSETSKVVKELKKRVGENIGKLNNLEQAGPFKNELVWVIENCTEELEGLKNRRFKQTYIMDTYSRTFITKKGYQCKADLYLNGQSEVKGTHVSVYIGVEKGPFDNALLWPMDATISRCVMKNGVEIDTDSFSTLESLEAREAFDKPQGWNSQWGWPKFLSHKSIPDYLVDGTLTLKISVA